MSGKTDIRQLRFEELQESLIALKQPAFRAKQVYEWLWKKQVNSFEEMQNIPAALRQQLSEKFVFPQTQIADTQQSADGTIKVAFRLFDNNVAEGVLIPTENRVTACISSQVGCSLTCSFCATGRLKRVRNLFAWEIFDQVALLKKRSEESYGKSLSNVVYMGMGEPLLNYAQVLHSLYLLTSEDALGMSASRITLSTAGIAKMIKQLGDDAVRCNLAVSLHAANDEKRSTIMPINEQNSLQALKNAIRYFYEKTGTRITYEYTLLKGFNDSLDDARQLAAFCRVTPCKINLIEYNTIEDGTFLPSDEDTSKGFAEYLESKNLIVNIRRSRGKDIDAACGQLANKNKAALK